MYRILDGVHRCVAAQRIGLTEILAEIDVGGKRSVPLLIPLSQIFSGKFEISRFDRDRDFNRLLEIMANDIERLEIDAVVLVELQPRYSKYFVRLADVQIQSV